MTLKNYTGKKVLPMSKPWMNKEGYPDPTPYKGMKHIIQAENEQEKRLATLIFVLKYIIHLAGFELLNRIELKDKKSGKVFR